MLDLGDCWAKVFFQDTGITNRLAEISGGELTHLTIKLVRNALLLHL